MKSSMLGAVLGAVGLVMAITGCGEEPAPAPKGFVTGVNPHQCYPGDIVSINGEAMGRKGRVHGPGGKSFEVTKWAPSTITVKVPLDQAPETIALTVLVDDAPLGSADLRVVPRPGSLSKVDPEVGRVGQTATVTGRGLGTQDKGKVYVYGGQATEVLEWTPEKIRFKIPPLPPEGGEAAVWIETDGGKSNTLPMAIVKPRAEQMIPDPAPPEKVVKVRGRDFGPDTGKVVFGAKRLFGEIRKWSEREIEVKLPQGVTGEVEFRVVNANGPSFPVLVTVLEPPPQGRVTVPPGKHVMLLMDALDAPHIFTFNPDGNRLWLTRWGKQGWEAEQILVQMGKSEGVMPAIAPGLEEKIKGMLREGAVAKADKKAVDAKIEALVAAEQAKLAGQKFSISAAGLFPRATFSGAGRLHLTIYDSPMQKIVHGERDPEEGTWTFRQANPAAGAREGMFSDVAVDAKGTVHVAYMDALLKQVKHATLKGDAFVTDPVDPEQDAGLAIAMALDGRGRPHLAYLDFGKFDLKYAGSDGAKFNVERVDAGGWTGDMPSIVIDDKDNPLIAFMKRDDAGLVPMAVKLATRDGGKWAIETVEEGPGIGLCPVLKRDAKGTYHLAYIDQKQKAIRYLSRKGTTGPWNKQTIKVDDLLVDLEPEALSMAVGSDGAARLVFWNVRRHLFYRVMAAR